MLRRQFSHESGKTELVRAREEYFDRRYVSIIANDNAFYDNVYFYMTELLELCSDVITGLL